MTPRRIIIVAATFGLVACFAEVASGALHFWRVAPLSEITDSQPLRPRPETLSAIGAEPNGERIVQLLRTQARQSEAVRDLTRGLIAQEREHVRRSMMTFGPLALFFITIVLAARKLPAGAP